MKLDWSLLLSRSLKSYILLGLVLITALFIPMGPSALAIISGITIGTWIASANWYKDWRLWINRPWFWAAVVFSLIHWLGLVWSPDTKIGISFALRTWFWLLGLAIISTPQNPDTGQKVYLAVLMGIAGMALVSFMQCWGWIPMRREMPAGFIGHIEHSLLLVFGMVMASWEFAKEHRLGWKIFWISLLILFILNMTVSWGRAGYLSLAIFSPVIAWNLFGGRRIFLALLLIAITGGLMYLSPTVQYRVKWGISDIQHFQNNDPNTSLGGRLVMWKNSMTMIKEHPFIGTGTGSFTQVYTQKYSTPPWNAKHPHNLFLYLGVSFGLLGILSGIAFFSTLIWEGFKYRHTRVGYGLLIYILIMLIGSMTEIQLIVNPTGPLLALLGGLLAHLPYPSDLWSSKA